MYRRQNRKKTPFLGATVKIHGNVVATSKLSEQIQLTRCTVSNTERKKHLSLEPKNPRKCGGYLKAGRTDRTPNIRPSLYRRSDFFTIKFYSKQVLPNRSDSCPKLDTRTKGIVYI